MDSGSEITAKIRSAIKAKLVELGAYVDDELPDYIMVMIANKKTKEQMTNDLNLFLGKNSLIFTDWVHSVLDRLQAISQKSGGPKSGSVEKEKKSSSHKTPKKENVNSSKRAEKPPSPARKASPLIRTISPVPKKESSSNTKENKERGETRSNKKRKDIVVENVINKNTVNITATLKAEPADDEDVLDMQTSIIGDALDMDIAGHKQENGSAINERENKMSDTRVSNDYAFRKERSSIYGSSSSNYRSPQKIVTVRPMKRRSPSPKERSSRKRRSVVKVMPRRVHESAYNDYYDDEEEDYKRKRHQVDSIVRVSERKYNVPSTMQPRPSIFLKALNEANASVSRHKSSSRKTSETDKDLKITVHEEIAEEYEEEEKEDEEQDTCQDTYKEPMHTEEYNPEISEPIAAPIVCSTSTPVSYSVVPEAPMVLPPSYPNNIDSRRVELKETISSSNIVKTEALLVDSTNTMTDAQPTRFVVTLDGVSSSFVKKIRLNEEDLDDSFESEIGLIREVSSSVQQVQSSVASISGVQQNERDDDEDTLIVGLDDDLNDDLPQAQINEVKICLDDDDDEDENDETASAVNTVPSEDGEKIMERCKYWPICKLGANCSYHHPSVPCKTFPKCRFGDRCLFIHPNCRYDSFCTNQHCPFSHSGRYREAAQNAPKIVMKPLSSVPAPCKFGGRCLNPACIFSHPKPCAYGANCLRPGCLFSHPIAKIRPSVPSSTVQKFKWVAPPQKSTSVSATITVTTAATPNSTAVAPFAETEAVKTS